MQPIDASFYLRKRYFVVALSFIGYVIMCILRINLSVCMVDMTYNKVIAIDNTTSIREAEYHWTPSQKGIILSSFSCGLLTAPLTVTFVNIVGASTIYGISLLATGILTILSPTLIETGLYVYIFGRFLEGVTEGLAISATYGIFTKWVPVKERSRLINLIHLGMAVGTTVGYPLCGYINFILDWKYVFYITGAITIGFCLLWISFIRSSPSTDNMITQAERLYLESIIEPPTITNKKVLHVWKSVLTSKPTLAFLNEVFVDSWSFSFLTYFLPMFIKDMHDVTIDEIGILSSLPHIFGVISRILGSWYQDYLRTESTMTKTKGYITKQWQFNELYKWYLIFLSVKRLVYFMSVPIHKIYIAFGQVSAVVLLITIGLINNFYGCIAIFCLFKIGFTMAECSYTVLPVDMASHHAAAVASLVILSMSVGYILNPLLMNWMVANHTHSEWSHYFWFLCLFNIWGLVIFSQYGSAEVQPWACSEEGSEKKKSEEGRKEKTRDMISSQ